MVITGTTTAATFLVDGVSVGTISTNMPTTNATHLCGHTLLKTLGTGNIFTEQDYFEFTQTLTNAR